MRSTEDEDSPKGYRSPKPATPSGGEGRKALFAGNGDQLGGFDRLRRERAAVQGNFEGKIGKEAIL